MEAALLRLQKAFGEAIPLSSGVDYEQLAYGKTAGWDSVAHMTLINHIEEAFDLMLDTDDVIGLSSFPKAKEILGKRGIVFA